MRNTATRHADILLNSAVVNLLVTNPGILNQVNLSAILQQTGAAVAPATGYAQTTGGGYNAGGGYGGGGGGYQHQPGGYNAGTGGGVSFQGAAPIQDDYGYGGSRSELRRGGGREGRRDHSSDASATAIGGRTADRRGGKTSTLCKFFHSNLGCHYPERCGFSHDQDYPGVAPPYGSFALGCHLRWPLIDFGGPILTHSAVVPLTLSLAPPLPF